MAFIAACPVVFSWRHLSFLYKSVFWLTSEMPCYMSLYFVDLCEGKMQEEGMRKVDQLKAELSSLQEVQREEERKGLALQQAHTTLREELEKEQVRNQGHCHCHCHAIVPQ